MFSSSGFKEKLQSSCLLITPGNSGELALSLYLKHHCSGACPFSNSLVNIYLSQALFGYKEWRHSELFKYKETSMRRRAKRQHISRLLEIQVAIKWLFYLFFLKFYKLLLALSSRATQEYICSLSLILPALPGMPGVLAYKIEVSCESDTAPRWLSYLLKYVK